MSRLGTSSRYSATRLCVRHLIPPIGMSNYCKPGIALRKLSPNYRLHDDVRDSSLDERSKLPGKIFVNADFAADGVVDIPVRIQGIDFRPH